MKKTLILIVTVLIAASVLGVAAISQNSAGSGHALVAIKASATNNTTKSYYTNVYIVSTYPDQSQQLYAAPGQSGILMYPYWNISLVSEAPHAVNYSVYINGLLISKGTFTRTYNVVKFINSSIATAQVSIGFTVYRFTDLPISSIPLNVLYAPPPPVPIYTQIFLDIFQVKAMVAAALSLIFSVMVVGKLTVAKKERTVIGGG
jgi:hypothetical protein